MKRVNRCWRYFLIGIIACLVAACQPVQPLKSEAPTVVPPPSNHVDVRVASRPIRPGACGATFIAHDLDHTTTVPGGETVRMFEANGSGLAINDLDNDGDLEIVLANHAGTNTILWNRGNLTFQAERMGGGDARGVTIVDVDSDGWQDIIFTRTASAPNYWRNQQDGTFRQVLLARVAKPLYTINWADLDGDDDLDFVGATYDAALLTDFGHEFLNSGNAGVYIYTNDNGHFREARLADNAQALALVLLDLNHDNWPDILVGNDFGVPDFAWLNEGDGWRPASPFQAITHSTMSFGVGDVNNDGQPEIFASDMLPYHDDPETAAAWAPVVAGMMDEPHLPDDPQVMQNVLQVHDLQKGYANNAEAFGIHATGWSWSGKFGDLDQDGLLDLYVVNGFMEAETFGHLPNHELVEENQALHNSGDDKFKAAPEWGLGSTRSGRGMSMADLDGDGDLDIVVNNLRTPSQLHENRLCTGQSLQVDLAWEKSANRRAIGATLMLQTSQGDMYRQVTAASGYLSGDAARLHFGFPQNATLDALEIHWPDGRHSVVQQLRPNTIMQVTRLQFANVLLPNR